MASDFAPRKEDKFTFGLWTVGNRGADPFGPVVRPQIPAPRIVAKLAELGAYGVSLHDNDLVPIGAPDAEQRIKDFEKSLKDNGMVVAMGTTNLFSHPVFRDGAFTNPDPAVRRFALQKTCQSIDMSVGRFGAKIYVFWGGREGSETDAGKDAMEAVKRNRECFNYLTHYCKDKKYDVKFALEAKPNEPRADIYLPTTGAVLGFISTLDHPEMVGVNPEVGHETMAGLNFYHVVAQAIEAGKLFHIDLNNQKIGRFDQDLRFGSEDIKGAFFLVKLLEESGYAGPRHFDAHAYRTEDEAGVWEFAKGCMRTYKIMAHKAKLFAQDKEIQALINKGQREGMPKFSKDAHKALMAEKFDIDKMAEKGSDYERLDQLVIDLILGLRG
ncbi:MAG TPA: xylose isomerase [Planctomycetota bacterium]|nr:xylose isomerase [Planctomycetota bacterium]